MDDQRREAMPPKCRHGWSGPHTATEYTRSGVGVSSCPGGIGWAKIEAKRQEEEGNKPGPVDVI